MTSLTTVTFASTLPDGGADLLVIGVTKQDDALGTVFSDAAARGVPRGLDLAALGASTTPDAVVRIPGAAADVAAVALCGISPDAPDPLEALRRTAGVALRTCDAARVVVALPIADVAEATAVAEGALLGAHRYDAAAVAQQLRGTDAPAPQQAQPPAPGDRAGHSERPTSITVLVPDAIVEAARQQEERVLATSEAVASSRDLVDAPPNLLVPDSFALQAKEAARLPQTTVTILDDEALRAGGYGGLVGVGQGSSHPPRLVKVAYTPDHATTHVALVGKGITFDSGGLSLKTPTGMRTMRMDMAGAAAVLHATIAAARLRLPVAVTAWLCLAENLPSANATRPSDVLTMRDGTTVEVLNTDAEGRLVLADGLAAAREDEADLLVDVATLTGAQMVALGDRIGAAMGSPGPRDQMVEAARTAGEQLWPMPLPHELRASLDSPVADLANVGGRAGGMLVAGLFLQEFAGTTPWVHLDVAGPAFNDHAGHDYTPRGGTGFGVRTLVEFLEQLAR